MDQDRPEIESGPLQPVRVYPMATVAAWAIVVALVLFFFRPVRYVFLGVLAASSLAAALIPLRDKIPGPRGFRALIAGILPILIALIVFAGLSIVFAQRFQEELSKWPETRQHINDWLLRVSAQFYLSQPLTVKGVALQLVGYFAGGGAALASESASVTGNLVVGLAFLFFGNFYLLFSDRSTLLHPVLKALPPRRRSQIVAAVNDLEPRLRWWAIGAVASMALVGAASAIGYTLIGLDMALPLAAITGLSEIVPTLGPLTSFTVAVLFAATQGVGKVVSVIILYLLIQSMESYIIHPYIMKRAIQMPPVVTLFTLVLWGMILGPAGLLLALPINLVIISFADHLLRRAD
ncbi:MAG: AI-2E family transporter [Candidatus Hydrogenedentes bacterium]|nr:AI-2E family transporter [Candidatus Hydrogenedentota bacterium]